MEIDEFIQFIRVLFDNNISLLLIKILLLLGITYYLLHWLTSIISLIKNKVIPLFYKKEDRKRVEKRKLFIEYIIQDLTKINRQEEWADHKFTELEAEVEAEGRWINTFLPFIHDNKHYLRHINSLSKAISQSKEKVILLEGDPGSGKSVALRHIALKIAKTALRNNRVDSLTPIYINLKYLEIEKNQVIDSTFIKSFVLDQINKVNDRDIEEFLKNEFVRGLESGSWLFLFDSFDEIPQILSSTESDAIINKYSEALSDFFITMNRCTGIISSRHFRGPKIINWPIFRILPFSEKKLSVFIKRNVEKEANYKEVITSLYSTKFDFLQMGKNPMFLSILCSFVNTSNKIPKTTYEVYEAYVNYRFIRDQERLLKKFSVEPNMLIKATETIAFFMTLESSMGLSPARDKLITVLKKIKLPYEIDKILTSLEYLKIGKSDELGFDSMFSFSHRRFQEYFATSYILQNPRVLEAKVLLSDARWRETAVTLLQIQPLKSILPTLLFAENAIKKIAISIPNLVSPKVNTRTYLATIKRKSEEFEWPKNLAFILEILSEGLGQRREEIPPSLKEIISRILLTIYCNSCIGDKKIVLSITGAATEDCIQGILEDSLKIGSSWLNNVTYKQAANLNILSNPIKEGIRLSLQRSLLDNSFKKNQNYMYAFLNRFDSAENLLFSYSILSVLEFIDILIMTSLFLLSIPLFFFFYKFKILPFIGATFFISTIMIMLTWITNSGARNYILKTRRTYTWAAFFILIFLNQPLLLPSINFSTLIFTGLSWLPLSWASTAYYFSEIDINIPKVFWPFFPFYYYFQIILQPIKGLFIFFRNFRKNIQKMSHDISHAMKTGWYWILLAIISIFILIVMLGFLIARGYFLYLSSPVLVVSLYALYKSIHDVVIIKRWINRHKNNISQISELYPLIIKLINGKSITNVFELILSSKTIDTSVAAYQGVNQTTLELENILLEMQEKGDKNWKKENNPFKYLIEKKRLYKTDIISIIDTLYKLNEWMSSEIKKE